MPNQTSHDAKQHVGSIEVGTTEMMKSATAKPTNGALCPNKRYGEPHQVPNQTSHDAKQYVGSIEVGTAEMMKSATAKPTKGGLCPMKDHIRNLIKLLMMCNNTWELK